MYAKPIVTNYISSYTHIAVGIFMPVSIENKAFPALFENSLQKLLIEIKHFEVKRCVEVLQFIIKKIL